MKKKNKFYPWLYKTYTDMINLYKLGRWHHSVLIFSSLGLGCKFLVLEVVRFFMCYKKIGIKSCQVCRNCLLISFNSHPDFYCISPDRKKKVISIEEIRFLIERLLNHSHQGGLKIIYISYVEKLTKESSNALLKFLEEPTRNTYFFLECSDEFLLNKKIKSRCLFFYIKNPKEKEIFLWLKKNTINITSFDIKLAMKIEYNVPLKVLTLLRKENWDKRKIFYSSLMKSLLKKNILDFITQLNTCDFINKIKWIITLLLDVFKYKFQSNNLIINQDQIYLIDYLNNINSNFSILTALNEWKKCYYILNYMNNLNKEIQLISCLSIWQGILFEQN